MAASRRFPSDHHGPLAPPPAFAERRASLSGAALDDALAAAIEEVLILQQDAWISLATDGELRRRFGGTVDPLAEARAVMSGSPMAVKVRLPAPAPGATMTDSATLSALLETGVRYVQLDGSAYAPMIAAGGDAGGLARRIAADAAVLASVSPAEGVKIAVCLFDPLAPAGAAGTGRLDEAAARSLFEGLGANRYIFDCGDGPGRDFSFLSLLPGNVDAVLGLFDPGAPALPDPDSLVEAIDEAAKVIDTDRFSLIPRRALSLIGGSPQAAWDRQKEVLDHILDVSTRAWGIDF